MSRGGVHHEVLPTPLVEFQRDEAGRILSAYIKLRTGKARRAVWPNHDHLVYFYLGRDDLPVGIKLLEPVTGWAISWPELEIRCGPNGIPVSVGREVRHAFLTSQHVRVSLAIANRELLACS